MTVGPLSGVVVVDKPVGPTSFDVVRQARRTTGVRRVGHGGTLDPLASGVLPICFGEATKLAQFLLDADKEYEATICFGVETDSYDAAGNVVSVRPTAGLDEASVRAALARAVGPQLQVPPLYSALKRRGRPLYAYARAGQAVERQARPITIHALELRAFAGPTAVAIALRCSKGTYVRSLAHDLGATLATGAHLTALRRTRSGPFTLAASIPLAALGAPDLPVVSPADALAHLGTAIATPVLALALTQGKTVPWSDLGGLPPGEGPVRILSQAGALVAVARREPPNDGAGEPRVRTLRVFG
jgi:tRNA pseudouridine55 synthase